ncbi:hypothetical protein TcWFU_003617 [Taenia crassiceps]|uniref:Uncharacterized protein n=1 Tax=Taenia crassiceps TaxID=6207 RepID=A0ABR4Q327_9CEST
MSGGAAVMNIRQSSRDAQVLKVGSEMFDQEGHRVDVTVWFRHRNEALYYLDSGGNLHGPLDLKHSSKLDGVRKSSGSFIKKSWVEGQRSQSSTRSEANYQTLDGRRSRTYSETRGHVSAEIDGLLDDLNRMRHRESLSNRTSMTRWSSLGTVRGDGGRYSTTLTRRHLKRTREPVDVYLKKPLTSNLSKVDLLSVENRNVSRVSPVTLQVDNRNAEREQRLMDELMETRRELQRTRSMMSEDGKRGLNYGSTLKVPINNEVSRNHSIRVEGKFARSTACVKLGHEQSLYK